MEDSYDWNNKQWSAPFNVTVSRITKLGSQLVSIGGGIRYWVTSPDSGPSGVGLRLTFTRLFPKRTASA